MHKAEERPDFAEINQELQSKVRTVTLFTILERVSYEYKSKE